MDTFRGIASVLLCLMFAVGAIWLTFRLRQFEATARSEERLFSAESETDAEVGSGYDMPPVGESKKVA